MRRLQAGSSPAVLARLLPRLRPRGWQLWSLPARSVAWLLAWEAATIAAFAVAIRYERAWGTPALPLFAALVVCASVHVAATKPSEERRRGTRLRTGRVEHVDQTSIWLFCAAVTLPPALIAAMVVAIRLQRYVIARRPPSRWFFSSCSIALSALGAHAVGSLIPSHAWLSGQPGASGAVGVAGLAAALGTYFAVQAILVGVGRALERAALTHADPAPWSLEAMIGTRSDNILILYTLLLAVFATVVAAFAPLALIAVVLVAVRTTRAEQQMTQLRAEREQLELDALHDALTGLPNRRGFEPQAELALVTDGAQGVPTAVLMADLDHFKDWNTRLGHFGADQVLTALAATVRTHSRAGDLVCRWGGEEIIFVLPGADAAAAAVFAERIRGAVEQAHVDVTKPAGGAPTTVSGCTLSLGVAVSPIDGTDLPTLQERADQALQRAKDAGRNQVCMASTDHSAKSG